MITYEGHLYISAQEFAQRTGRAYTSVRRYMCKGSKIRRLKVKRIYNKPFIPVFEVHSFPLAKAGRGVEGVCHIDDAQQKVGMKGYCSTEKLFDKCFDCDLCPILECEYWKSLEK